MQKSTIVFIIVAIIAGAALGHWWSKQPSQTENNFVTISSPGLTQTPTTTTIVGTTTTRLTLKGGKQITLAHPDNLAINVAADGYRHLRFMAKSPDGRLFVGEMHDAGDSSLGHVYIFENFDTSTGKFNTVNTYLSNLRNPNSVAFYTDASGQAWLYVALTDKLIRYPYHAGDNKPSSAPQIIATFPDYGNAVSAGGWHLTRTLAFTGDELYVSVGSSCNSCEEKMSESDRASILRMNPDGTGQSIVANGLRNAVGIAVVNGQLYATENNADHLGTDRPNDEFYKITPGTNYGWPWCYEFSGQIYTDTSQKWQHPIDCNTVPLAFGELEPHSAPLGFDYFNNQFLVALHGSGKKDIGTGYKIVAVDSNGKVSDFITGFLFKGAVTARPADVLVNDADSFFITDDFNGAIYYVRKIK